MCHIDWGVLMQHTAGRKVRRLGVAVGACAAMTLGVTQAAHGSHSTVTAVKGSAFGYHAFNLTLFGGPQPPAGPAPTVTLPASGGNVTNSVASASVTIGGGAATLFSSGPITVASQGAIGTSGSVTSTADIQNINTSQSEAFTATNLSSTCTAGLTGATGSTTVTSGTLEVDGGFDSNRDGDYTDPGEHAPVVVNLPATPAVNQAFEGHLHLSTIATDPPDTFRYVFNERVVAADGTLTVRALHAYLGTTPASRLKGDLILGEVVCDTTTAAGPNAAPVADDDAYATPFDTPLTVVAAQGVLVGDTDVDGGPLTAGSASNPPKGSVTLNADGSFTYTPDAGATGTDTFTYTVTDNHGATDTGLVTVTIGANPNIAPVAGDDNYDTAFNTPLVTPAASGVLANDSDANGDGLSASGASDPPKGSVTLGSDGSFTYTPDAGQSGTDTFTYTVSDGRGGSDTGQVIINISGNPNTAPVAVDDSYSTPFETQLVVAPAGGVLANDSDANGHQLTAGSASNPPKGSVILSSDGSFTYLPDPGQSGADTFTYVVSDGNGGTDTGLVTITIGDAPPPPTADLDVDVTGPAGPVDTGTPVSYTVVVTNLGAQTATGVSVLSTVTGGRLDTASGAGTCTRLKGKVKGARCDVATLAPGSSATFTVVVDAPHRPGSMAVDATVSSTSADDVVANNTAGVVTTVDRL